MSIKNTLLLLFFAILGTAGQHIQSAASSSNAGRPDILSSINDLKAAKAYPLPMQQTNFLETLSKSLELQDKIVALNNEYTKYDDDIDATYASINKLLGQILENGGTPTQYGSINGYVVSESLESIAFILRYKHIFCPPMNDLNKALEREIENMLHEWQDSEDPQVCRILDLIKMKFKNAKNFIHLADAVRKPLGLMTFEWAKIKEQNPLIQDLFVKSKERCPLLFIHNSVLAYKTYCNTLIAKANAGTFIDNRQEEDIVYRAQREEIAKQYDLASEQLCSLKKDIKQTLIRLAPKAQPTPQACMPPKKGKPQQRTSKKKKQTPQPRQIATQIVAQTNIALPQEPAPELPTEKAQSSSAACSSVSQSEPTVSSATEKKRSPRKHKNCIESDAWIKINDEQNKCIITLFKVSKPQTQFTSPRYTRWVKAWFENPEKALIQQGYTDPTNPKFKYRTDAAITHGFTTEVDTYLSVCGTQSTIASKSVAGKRNHLITIPGSIRYPDGKEHLGLFIYIIDSTNNEWHHRNFIPRTANQLVSNYLENGYYDVEFPELH